MPLYVSFFVVAQVNSAQSTLLNGSAYRGARGIYADFTRPFAAGGYSGAVAFARGADASTLIFASGTDFGLAEHALSDAGVGKIS